jgi:hypothetical protein
LVGIAATVLSLPPNLKTKTMKKVMLFVAVIAAASFTSCKKDRECTCTTTTTTTTHVYGSGFDDTDTDVSTETIIYKFTKAKKGDARAACLSYTYQTKDSDVSGGLTYDVTTDVAADCKLK